MIKASLSEIGVRSRLMKNLGGKNASHFFCDGNASDLLIYCVKRMPDKIIAIPEPVSILLKDGFS